MRPVISPTWVLLLAIGAFLVGCMTLRQINHSVCMRGPISRAIPHGPLLLGDSLTLRAGSEDALGECDREPPAELTWASTDTSVFTVTDGVVAPKAPGSAEVILRAGIGRARYRLVVDSLRPDRIPAFDSFTVVSSLLRENRVINVHLPAAYATEIAASFPVLYMPDGGLNEDFPHVVNTVDSLVALRLIRPVIIVGIPNTERRRDLTSPTRLKADSEMVEHPGGAANFRRFIGEELMPEVEHRYRTTQERSIVGESLAGFFIVEYFLREPTRFAHYIALDPSVWWNGGSIIDSAAALLGNLDAEPRSLYLASSNVEEMVAGTTKLAKTLRAGSFASLRWEYWPRPDLRHHNIFRQLAPQAFIHALQ